MSLSIGTVYTRPWLWKKGNRISVVGDTLTIKIGGNSDEKKGKKKQSNRIKSTKYSVITFFPQNLLEQFRRIANFYFLVMTVISVIIDSPVSPLTSLLPLAFVITVTAAKQGYEDYLRHRADNMVNYSLVTVIRNGEETDIKCQDIVQGDLVKVPRDCDVPCDLVLLKSSDSHSKCHITTANLDGESNLKTLSVPKGLPYVEISKLHTLGIIECEIPRTDLYTFNGKVELALGISRSSTMGTYSNVLPLMAENLMLRGSRVKNTEWAIGCAVYTGQNTKLALNSKITRNKMSSSENYINRFLVFFLLLLIGVVTVMYFLKRYADQFRDAHNFYLGEVEATFQVSQFLQDYFSFLILFNYLIPISLYVTIEMHKFLGSFFMEWDPELYDEELNQPCIVNTSDLNEELGQVQILFSDKTGTLTKNIMIFQQCSINGRKYLHKGLSVQDLETFKVYKIHEFKDEIFNFFEALAICHTVQIAGTSEYISDIDILDPSKTTVYKNNNEDESITFSQDSEPDDVDFFEIRPRISNESNASRPITLMEFERISMKNNLTRRTLNGDFFNPRLNRNLNGNVYHDINFLGKHSFNIGNNNDITNNINDLHDIPSIKSVDKVSKRPISEILNFPSMSHDNRVHPKQRRPLSTIESATTTPSDENRRITDDIEEVNYIPNPAKLFMANQLKRAVSVNDSVGDGDVNEQQKTHRRTQSYQPSTILGRSPILPVKRIMSRQSSNISIAMANSREYYAAPSYTEASLLERKESVLKKGVLKTVIDKLDYQASSPDEKALVEACARLGIIYSNEDNDIVTLELKRDFYRSCKENYDTVDAGLDCFRTESTNVIKYERLAVLEFTSDRKRMSVIVKDRRGQIWLYTKGAESYVFPLCNNTTNQLLLTSQQHVNDFAKTGLRTLAVARRKLSNLEFINFNQELIEANNSLTDRKALVALCHSKIESNLELMGATAVEDALQDNVRDTLEALRIAGIRVWVLTGDKVETALNIAISCGHIPENSFKYFITECLTNEQIEEHLKIFDYEMAKNPNGIFTLLIDGPSLTIALKHSPEQFRDIAIKCRAVLCCRLSPLQKCEVVQLMKTVEDKPITAAIGDGANDVSMIQEAHVGLGIVGKEGRQAARCADYAFANFSMVKRILLVHGHYYTQRLAILVLYFFYKNLVFMSIQFLFQIHCMFSSQSIYDSLFLTLFNVVYTALPILVLSLTEKTHSEKELMRKPELYKTITRNRSLHWEFFCGWMLLAAYHGSIIYVFTYFIWINNPAILPSPRTVDFACFGTFMIHNVAVLVNLKLWMEAIYQSNAFIASIWISILGFMATTFVYNLFNFSGGSMLHVYNTLCSSLTFWLLSIIIVIAALLPDYTMIASRALNMRLTRLFPNLNKSLKNGEIHNGRRVQSTYL